MKKLTITYFCEEDDQIVKTDEEIIKLIKPFTDKNNLQYDGTSYGFKNNDRTLYYYKKKEKK